MSSITVKYEEISEDEYHVTPEFKHNEFIYDEVKISENGYVWGYWGKNMNKKYRDGLGRIGEGFYVADVSKNKIILKRNQLNDKN